MKNKEYSNLAASICIAAILFSTGPGAYAQSINPMDFNNTPSSNFDYQPTAETYVPQEIETGGPSTNYSGPVYETMEPEWGSVSNTTVTNNTISNSNSKNPGSSMCAQLPSGNNHAPSYSKGSVEDRYLSAEEQKVLAVQRLMNKYGIESIVTERRDPAHLKLGNCNGGYQKKQCFALLKRSLTDPSQAGSQTDPKFQKLDITKSWQEFKDAIVQNPGHAKEQAIAKSLNEEKKEVPGNFVMSPEADDNARLQVSAEAVGMIDYQLALGNGEEAKRLLDRLQIINPSAASALSCLVDSNEWTGNSYALQSDPTKDKVGPLSGTVFYKYDPEKETGIFPLLIAGGIAAAEGAGGAAIVGGGTAALTAGGVTLGQVLTGIGLAAGAVLLSESYQEGPKGILVPHGSYTPPPAPPPPKPPKKMDPVTKGVILTTISIPIGTFLGWGATKITEKLDEKYFPKKEPSDDKKEPSDGKKEPKTDSKGPKSGAPGDGNPHFVEPEIIPLRVEVVENTSPVVETDSWFQDFKKQIEEMSNQSKADQLLQELSIYHFVDSESEPTAANSIENCELTDEQRDELAKHYAEDTIIKKMLDSMPIDFRKSDWNNLPHELEQQCAVVDPAS